MSMEMSIPGKKLSHLGLEALVLVNGLLMPTLTPLHTQGKRISAIQTVAVGRPPAPYLSTLHDLT